MFWLAMSLAGHKFAAIGLAVVFLFVPFAVNFLVFIARIYIYGFANRWFYFNTDVYLSPIIAMARRWDFNFYLVAIYVVFGLLLYAGAFFISRARKAEFVGDMFVFARVKLVVVFLGAFATMIFGGLFALRSFLSVEKMYLGLAIGFVIGFFIAWIIAEKSFFILHKAKLLPHFCGVVVGLYVLMLFVTQIGIGFWVNHIPPQEQVERVTFFPNGTLHWRYHFLSNRVSTDDPENIMQIQDFHRDILAARPFPHRSIWFFIYEWNREYFYNQENYVFVSFTYYLTDRQEVVRLYIIPREFAENRGMMDFFYSDEIIIQRHHILRSRNNITEIEINFGEQIYPALIFTDRERISTLMDAFAEGIISDTRQIRAGELRYEWSSEAFRMLPEMIFRGYDDLIMRYRILGHFRLQQDFKTRYLVLNLLEEWGYIYD
jgi:hypothetical protein